MFVCVSVSVHACMCACVSVCVTVQYDNKFVTFGHLSLFLFADLRDTTIPFIKVSVI